MRDIRKFSMRIGKIQPSQLFISSEELSQVLKMFKEVGLLSMEPVPIKRLGTEIVFVDGHTRALAAYLHGLGEIRVYWEHEELDWDAYAICVEWCKRDGIHPIADMKDRIVSPQDYEALWLRRCERMQQGLRAKSEH